MASPRNDAVERPRRFYKAGSVVAQDAGFAVALDGRTARTPAGGRLVLPTRALAELVAEDWARQDEVIDLTGMLATRLAFTAIDADHQARAALAAEAARYAGSDLLCYFADGPQPLLEREVAHWGPVLEWAEQALGVAFERATGIVHRPQPPATVARVKELAEALDGFSLAGLAFGVGLFGSAILAFAVQRGQLTGDAAFDLHRLDEAYQEERWGVDAEAAERTAALRRDAARLERWFEAVRTQGTPD